MKKAGGMICIVLGTYLVFLLLTLLSSQISGQVEWNITIYYIFGIIGVILIPIGIKLWNWSRIKKILGIVFIALGGMFLVFYLSALGAKAYNQEQQLQQSSNFVQGIYVAIFLPIGIILLIRQYNNNKLKSKITEAPNKP